MCVIRSARSFAQLVWAVVLLVLAGCAANRPPLVAFTATPTEGYETLVVLLDARATRDPDGDTVFLEWRLGDGTTATVSLFEHAFEAGSHEVRLVARDDRGGVSETAQTITVRPVPEGFVVRRCAWTWRGRSLSCELLIPWDLYQMYRARLRTTIGASTAYGDYVDDPLDDPTLGDYADILWELSGGTIESFVGCTLAFVQGSVAYRPDPVGREWPWYPLETLTDAEGDCEDTAILFVSLLRARGVASSLAFVDTDDDRLPDHVLALIPVSTGWASRLACPHAVLEIGDTLYAVAETAVDDTSLELGCDPWGLRPADVVRTWPF